MTATYTYELILENATDDVFRGIVLEVETSETFPDGVRSVADIMEVSKTDPRAAHYLATFAQHRNPTLVRVPSPVDFGRARAMKTRVQKVLDYFLERDRIEADRAA